PSPSIVDVCPTTIVERRPSPLCIVDPGPSPVAGPYPVSVAIRRPTGNDPARIPDGTIARILVPRAIGVEIGGARHVGRHVSRRGGHRRIDARVARPRPLRELIGRPDVGEVVRRRAVTLDGGHL